MNGFMPLQDLWQDLWHRLGVSSYYCFRSSEGINSCIFWAFGTAVIVAEDLLGTVCEQHAEIFLPSYDYSNTACLQIRKDPCARTSNWVD